MLKGDGIKRLGRFLSKSSAIYKQVKVEEYNFEDISSRPFTYPDNPRSNVIHQWLHEKEEVDRAVRRPAAFYEEFVETGMRAPIIRPRDFTNDWIEERKKARRRSSNQFADEDEFEMALEEAEEEEKGGKDDVHPKDIGDAILIAIDKTAEEAQAARDLVERTKQYESQLKNSSRSPDSQEGLEALQKSSLTSMDAVGEAIKDFSQTGGKGRPSPKITMPPAKAPNFEMPAMEAAPPSLDSTGVDVERIKEEAIEEGKKIGQELGYQEGHASGSEQGYREASQKVLEENQALVQSLSEMQKKIDELSSKVMDHCQENFLELSAAICESILEREFNADPQAFGKLVKKAMREAMSEETVTIKIDPKMHEALSKTGELPNNWIADPSVGSYSFVVESEKGVVRSDVKTIVASLLAKAEINLFDNKGQEEESANKDDKENS